MSEHTVSGGTSAVNQSSLLSLGLAVGGGVLPAFDGWLSARVLGLLLGRNERTIRDAVSERGIPHRKIGSQIFLRLEDFLAAHPIISTDDREED